MSKKQIVAIVLVLSVVLLLVYVVLIALGLSYFTSLDNEDTFLISSESPDGNYRLEAYRTNPGATVDFSVKVYIVSDKSKKLIYNAYHENKAEIRWESDSIVVINTETLDLSKKETYDWRKK